MQCSQEVLLLRDAMASAAHSRGYFSTSNDNVLSSAKLIKDTVKDVTDIMTVVDEKSTKDIREAHRNMHAVLFHKALQSSGKEEGTLKEHFGHVCTTIPFVSWSVYVQTILFCSWQVYAEECWASVSVALFLDTAEMMLKNLPTLDDDNTLSLWRRLLRRSIAAHSIDLDEPDYYTRIADIISDALLCNCCVETMTSKRAAVIFEQLNFLCEQISRSNNIRDFRRTLSTFITEADTCLENLDFMNASCAFAVCHFSVKKLLMETDGIYGMDETVTAMIGEWPERARNLKVTDDDIVENESVDLMKSMAATENPEFSADGLDKLIHNLATDIDDKVISFLSSRCHQLNQRHVATLMAVRLVSADLKTSAVIPEICVRAFSSWGLDVQDVYRNEYHKKYGLRFNENAWTSGEDELTDIVNRISSADDDVETSTISDLSRLCLTFPMETIKILVEYAIKSGQIKSVVKILFHLKGTCSVAVSPDGGSLLMHTVKAFILDNELRISFWTNCKTLVEQLLFKSTLLNATEFLKNLIATLLLILPSLCGWRLLQIFQIILHTVDDENSLEIWTAVDLGIVLLIITQVLDDCASSTFGPDNDRICDLLLAKKEALVILRTVTEFLRKYPHVLSIIDRAALLKSTTDFHKPVLFRLQFIVDRIDHSDSDFKDTSVADLLQIASVSEEVFNMAISHLRLNHSEIFEGKNGDILILVSLVKILARLTVNELRVLMDVMIECYRTSFDESEDKDHAINRAITAVTEALIALSGMNQLSAAHEHILVQNLTTTVMALLEFHKQMKNTNILINVVCTMARLSSCLVVPENKSVPKLLIVDLVKRIFKKKTKGKASVNKDTIYQSYIVMATIRALNDDTLLNTVTRLSPTTT